MINDELGVAVTDVQDALAQCFNEAVQTHGLAVTMSAVVGFAATALHNSEHESRHQQAREIVLGQWTEHFHAYLRMLNQQCDDSNLKPEGVS